MARYNRSSYRNNRSYRQQFDSWQPSGMSRVAGQTDDGTRINTQAFIEAAAAAVRAEGWKPSRNAYQEINEDATWRRALQIVNDRELAAVTIDDIQLADSIRYRWHPTLKATATDEEPNDYLTKLVALLKQDELALPDLALAASAVISYQRAVAREEAAKQSRHVGKVGERSDFAYLKLTESRPMGDNGWGYSYLYKFIDAAGNRVTMFTGSTAYEVGHVYTGRATVKAHNQYGGVAETVVTRAKFEELAICPTCGSSYTESDPELACTCVVVDDALLFAPGEFDIIISG